MRDSSRPACGQEILAGKRHGEAQQSFWLSSLRRMPGAAFQAVVSMPAGERVCDILAPVNTR